jgi:hypothetical protein
MTDVIKKERDMKKTMWTAAAVLGALLTVPGLGLAAQTKPMTPPAATKPATQPKSTAKTAAKESSAKPAATHSAAGVVKSMDASSLVITRGTGKKATEMTFALDNSTKKEGNVAVGSNVVVKYTTEAGKHTATDVSEKAAKPMAKAKSKTGKH